MKNFRILVVSIAASGVMTLVSAPGHTESTGREHAHESQVGGESRRHHRMPFAMEDPERMLAHISRRLDLDDDQQQQLQNVVLAAKPQMQSLRDRARSVHESIRSLDPDSNDYDLRVHELATESGQVATEMTLAMAGLRAQVHAVLTPEQKTALENMRTSARSGERRSRN